MDQLHVTPLSHLTDEEFLRHLLSKKNPTDEDVEAAIRLELLLNNLSSLLEEIHRASSSALAGTEGKVDTLVYIRDKTRPVVDEATTVN